MLVEEIMKTNVITLKEEDLIETALALLHRYHIRHIPIVDDENHIIGIISDRDVRDASPSILERDGNHTELRNPVKKIMKTNVITVHPLDFVEEIAAIFYENEIACLPVTHNNKLIGVVTEKDILNTLIQLTGAHQPGSQIEIKVQNISGMLSKVATIISNSKTNIQSVLVYPDPTDSNFKILVFRIQTMNPSAVIIELRNEGYTVLGPSLPGMRP